MILWLELVPKDTIRGMSNPRYIPRSFALHPYEFGRKSLIEWRGEEGLSVLELARLDAAHLQHGVAYGVTQLYMPRSPTRQITTLAEALEVPYARLQKMLAGYSVMQLEDLGRLRRLVGDSVDPWLLRGRHAALLTEGRSAMEREATRERRERLSRAGVQARPSSPPPMR